MITVVFKTLSSRINSNFFDEAGFQSFSVPGTHYRLINRPHYWRPPTDIYETDENLIVLVEIAGMREDHFVISVDRNLLSINGIRQDPLSEKRSFHQMEIPFGEFSTEIEFSIPIQYDNIEATYENGFLKIVLPKAKPKQIEITEG